MAPRKPEPAKKTGPVYRVHDLTIGEVVSPDFDTTEEAQAFAEATGNADHDYKVIASDQ
jgi:hypothetical protein